MGRRFDDATNTSLESATVPVQGLIGDFLPFTMCAWIRPVAANVRETIIGIYDRGSPSQWQSLGIEDAGQVQGFSRSGGGQGKANTSTSVTANVWQHACMIAHTNVLRNSYLDNRGEGTDSTDCTGVSAVTAIGVGELRDSSPGRNFTGDIAELGMWDIALNFFERDQLARWRYSPLKVRPEHLIWYRSFRFPDFNFDPYDELPPQLAGNDNHPLFASLASSSAVPTFGAHPPGIVYPQNYLTDMAIFSPQGAPPPGLSIPIAMHHYKQLMGAN